MRALATIGSMVALRHHRLPQAIPEVFPVDEHQRRLADVLGDPPEWYRSALCRGRSDVDFFASKRTTELTAKAVCAECPVRAQCAEHAIEIGAVGIWGGLNGRERATAPAEAGAAR